MLSLSLRRGVFLAGLAFATACGTSASPAGFVPQDASAYDANANANPSDAGDLNRDAWIAAEDAGTNTPPDPNGAVYAHSASQLYKINPDTKAITIVGAFSGCFDVVDLAIDQNSNAYVTTAIALYTLNLETAECTLVSYGEYPNSLSFVPKGTLDANEEALVGYLGSTYIRIDTTSGAVTTVGSLSQGYSSSGDIVSVVNGGTFLTVTGSGCGDCLLQVNPVSGDIVQNYGSVNHPEVYGLAFWAGTVYGFDSAGEMFTITSTGNTITTTDLPLPSSLGSSLSFYGAGSTTAAPVHNANDGGIPIK